MRRGIWGFIFCLLLNASAQAEEVKLVLQGLKGELKENTRIYLQQLHPIQVEQLPRFETDIKT
ncbi:MAG: hypothetical protein GX324_07725, partial [Aeromonadales bacterium]|nr:hypothetical protein [Aeromonadales bacterium]